jgi:hypothetical protein
MANILGFEPPVYVNPVVGLQMAVNIRADRIVFSGCSDDLRGGQATTGLYARAWLLARRRNCRRGPERDHVQHSSAMGFGGIASFQNLAPGEFIKTMCVRKDDAGDVARSALLHRTSCRIPIDGSQGPYDPTTVATLSETTTKHSASCP